VPDRRLAPDADQRLPWLPVARRSQKLDLSSIWLFSTCNARELRTVARSLEEVTAPAGTVLTEEGTIGREFFYIVEGRASVRRGGRKVALLGPGDYFGELALLDRAPRSATIVADTDMVLLNINQRDFYGLLEDVPPLGRKLLSAMATRVRDADSKVSALLSH
jgi:CRP/FNR family cyclic AMP-dependent transcriptional regulator